LAVGEGVQSLRIGRFGNNCFAEFDGQRCKTLLLQGLLHGPFAAGTEKGDFILAPFLIYRADRFNNKVIA